jgi:hypothetical protein
MEDDGHSGPVGARFHVRPKMMPRLLRRSSVLATGILLIVVAVSPLATIAPMAAASGGISGDVRGTAFYDRNNNAFYDPNITRSQFIPDNGLAGVIVRAFDSTGALVGSATTGADGTYLLSVSGAATNDVRVEFSFDATSGPLAGFTESLANEFPDFAGQSFGAVRFVKLGASAVTGIDYGLHKPSEFCLNNPFLITCLQPMGAASGHGVVGFAAQRLTAASGTSSSSDVVATLDTLGAVFGIGVDPAPHRRRTTSRPGNVFLGTFVKRHSEYGSQGATNTIYHLTLPRFGTGTVVPFVTLPGVLPLHDATSAPGLDTPYTADIAIFSRVGRIGLGDVDVMDDGNTLLAIDMDETAPKLYFIPIVEATGGALSAGTPASVAIPKPATFGEVPGAVPCVGTWHPMGIGTRGDRILVGGVCGAEDTVTPALPNGPHPTQSAAFVLEYSGTREGGGSFTTVFAVGLGYERGCTYNVGCAHETSEVGDVFTADWGAWNEYPRYTADVNMLGAVSNPQAMLANIEITDAGDLILGFRDRFADQVQTGSAAWSDAFLPGSTYPAPPFPYENASGRAQPLYNFAAGDMLRVCSSGGTFALEADGTCADGVQGSGYTDFSGTKEFYFDNYAHAEAGALHAETINGSTATISGYDGVWTTAYDISNIDQQGVLSFGDCADRLGGGACYPSNSTTGFGSRIGGINIPMGSGFAKGNGLADLEVLCDEAPVGIRSTIWHDLDGDGIRDPGEPAIAGVTVNLYDPSGNLVATAITDANGIYVFTSFFDGGTFGPHIQRGLIAEQEGFTVRLDNPADYALGGPLYGYYPTLTGATTPSLLDDDSLIDSDGVLTGGGYTTGDGTWPTITLDPLAPGEHSSAYSFGLVQRVALEGTLWIDADGDGIRDVGEGPLEGVTVTLYEADGITVVLRPDGTAVTATTAADGSYFIDDLAPGDYRALFTLPEGYLFTTPTVGSDGSADSDPVASTGDPLQGMTAVFTIAGSVTGDTTAETDTSTRASYVNATIDAGVVQLVAMGDYVWIDVDGDGVQDPDEPPLAGVVVTLYNPDGTRATDADGVVVAPAETDANGYYLIDNLLPGEYFATFTLPAGYEFTITGGGTPATDSDPSPTADPLVGSTPVFLITSAVSGNTVADDDPTTVARFINPTIDAGVTTQMVSLAGTLWTDTDRDGVLDAGESRLAGLKLRVTDLDGNPVLDFFGTPVADVTSAADGTYRFDRLPVGTYLVTVVDPPDGMTLTLPSATGTWRVELLTAGMHRGGVDFPYAATSVPPSGPDSDAGADGSSLLGLLANLPIPRSIPAGSGPRAISLGLIVLLAALSAAHGLRRRSRRASPPAVSAGRGATASTPNQADAPDAAEGRPTLRSHHFLGPPNPSAADLSTTRTPPPLDGRHTDLFAHQRRALRVAAAAPIEQAATRRDAPREHAGPIPTLGTPGTSRASSAVPSQMHRSSRLARETRRNTLLGVLAAILVFRAVPRAR